LRFIGLLGRLGMFEKREICKKRMKKKVFKLEILGAFFIVILGSLLHFTRLTFWPPKNFLFKDPLSGGLGIEAKNKNKRVCFKDACFEVELARTEEERAKGLMFRKELEENKGMLFVFEKEGIYPFWMKNTFLPLDIIWIDKDFRVVYISKNTPPCEGSLPCPSINPGKTAKYVLEINGGIAEKIGLGVGDTIDIQ